MCQSGVSFAKQVLYGLVFGRYRCTFYNDPMVQTSLVQDQNVLIE